MRLGHRGARSRALPRSAALLAALAVCLLTAHPASAAPASQARPATPTAGLSAKRPDLTTATAYLVAPKNLIDGHYYQSIPRFADFGLTIDGALALAAAGTQNAALRQLVAFINGDAKDASGKTIDSWTGIGTRFAAGGPIGKEALLAEVIGANPRHFGGHDLIATLDALICAGRSAGPNPRCPAAGSYAYVTAVFDQALGVLAQLRAGQPRQAAAPIRYLESLRNADGSFPSLIPGHDQDVDSTAMAVMALALAPDPTAATDVRSGLAWIAGRQEPDGGFPGAGGDSVNSAALAIQALDLKAASYRHIIAAAQAFLAGQQNADGGFNPAAGGQRGSDLRASAQAVTGTVGVPYGALHRDLTGRPAVSAGGHTNSGSGGGAQRPMRDCTATSGVIEAVDFGPWGGPLLRFCASTPTTDFALLNQAGWQTTGTEHDGPGFLCRIGYAGFHGGTQYPTPRHEACVLTPPANAYWTSWHAGAGQDTWTYSGTGAISYHPQPGGVDLWIFGGTDISGTSGSAVPAISPDQIRTAKTGQPPTGSAPGTPPVVNAKPLIHNATSADGSPIPALVTLGIVALLALLAVAARRRIRGSR